MPSFVDTALGAAGVAPVFGYRMSRQPSSLLSNPTTTLFDDAQKGVGAMAGNILNGDNQLSQQDVRGLAKAFPWGNRVPFHPPDEYRHLGPSRVRQAATARDA
ncbi:hypothetical protein ACXIUS_25760 [Bosea thiooxidans]